MSGTFSSKQKALAILPKCAGGLSLLGSTFIFQDVVRIRRHKRSSAYHNLMVVLSTYDMMASFCNILSTWPIPAGTPGVYGAVGTTETCTAQGFFAEVGNVSTPMYNAALTAYYILVIRNGWSEHRIRKVQGWFHVLPFIGGWTMGAMGLVFNLYNMSGWLCWFAPLPMTCHMSDDVPCVRGELAPLFRWVHYAIIWSSILFATVGMVLIYRAVLTKEQATSRFTNPAVAMVRIEGTFAEEDRRRERRRRKSRKVAQQAMLFVSAMYLTWIFTTLTRIFQVVHGRSYSPLIFLMAIFFPLQGLFNALIYLRPRYVKCRSKHPELSRWRICIEVILSRNPDREMSPASFISVSSVQRRASTRISALVSAARFPKMRSSSTLSKSSSQDGSGGRRTSAQATEDALASAAALAREIEEKDDDWVDDDVDGGGKGEEDRRSTDRRDSSEKEEEGRHSTDRRDSSKKEEEGRRSTDRRDSSEKEEEGRCSTDRQDSSEKEEEEGGRDGHQIGRESVR